MIAGAWKRAYDAHKYLLAIAAVYSLAVVLLALWWGVPAWNLLHILGYLLTSTLTALIVMTGIYLCAFFCFLSRVWGKAGGVIKAWQAATLKLDLAAREYMEGDRWTFACLAFLATMGDNFFFICKSLIAFINPYRDMKWDYDFMAWDKVLHFGHLPHEHLIPVINSLGLAHVLDVIYALWLVVMFIVLGYNLFADRVLYRRLRFLWTYVLSWIILGSVCAMWLSSVGPLFFHDFFPEANPYADLVANLENIGKDSFFFATKTRHLLLEWTTNERKFDPNSIAAMPSMHVAIAWLMVLYAGQINKLACAAAALFCLGVYLATVYFGIHYAVDSYVSIPVVTLIWWAAGKFLRRAYPESANPPKTL